MSELKPLKLTVDSDQIAWLVLDVPDESMNVLKMECIEQLGEVLTELENRQEELKGLVIYSGKPDSFIAGADINMIDRCGSTEEAAAMVGLGHEMFNRISQLPITTVVAIHGICLGGGAGALSCL